MKRYYYKNKICSANTLKDAKQLFEHIFKTKIENIEITNYDPEYLKIYKQMVITYGINFKIIYKNGAFHKKVRNTFFPEGTFDMNKAKTYKSYRNALKEVSHLFWLDGKFNNLQFNIDGVDYSSKNLLLL